MDGTLVGCAPLIVGKEVKCYSRPWLKEFLSFCFTRFDSVSIWTAANRAWFEFVDANIFQPLIYEINCEHGRRYQWRLALTQEHCYFHTSGNDLYTFKPLFKIWNELPFDSFRPENTVAIDDSPCTFTYNPENGIPIRRFWAADPMTLDWDVELLSMMCILMDLLREYKKIGDVREVIPHL